MVSSHKFGTCDGRSGCLMARPRLTSSQRREYQSLETGHATPRRFFQILIVIVECMHKAEADKIFRFPFVPTFPWRLRAEVHWKAYFPLGLCLLVVGLALLAHADKHRRKSDYGLGFVTEIPAPQSEVIEAVE